MNNVIKRTWLQNKMVSVEWIGTAFQAESGGHTFEISGADGNGNAVALSGTVSGVFLRPDNTDVAITGTASGGVASVTLPAECYAVPGQFALAIYVTANGQKTAVYSAIGTVARTSSGTVAPGATADVVDLINRISAAVATIPASWSGLMADIAPTYSESAVYPVGAYVYYNGDLYRCTTAITTAETWTAAHWTAAVIGNDLSNLNSAFDEQGKEISNIRTLSERINVLWVQGGLTNTNVETVRTDRIRTDYIPVADFNFMKITALDGYAINNVLRFDENKNKLQHTGPVASPYHSANAAYIRLALQKTNGTDAITPDEGTNLVFTGQTKMTMALNGLSQAVKIYSGIVDLKSGLYNVYGGYEANTKRMTTGIVYIPSPVTVTIADGYQMMYSVGDGTSFTDKGWVIVGGGSLSIDLSDGQYYIFNFAKTSLSEFTADDDIGLSFVFNDNTKNTYYVDVNGGGNFRSLLVALKSTPSNSKLVIMPGIYNMQTEYEKYYGSDYFTNYNGYDANDMFSRGYWVDGGRELDFIGGAKIVFRYDGGRAHVQRYFSVINTGTNATIKGCHIYYSNLRYAVHDDAAFDNAGTNTFEDMIIEGFPSSLAGVHWGGGCGKKNNYCLKNIMFIDDEMPDNYGDMYYHNNVAAGSVSRITLNSCLGSRGCTFRHYGQSEEITYCVVSGCNFRSIVLRQHTTDGSSPYENMKLVQFNNIVQ